MRERESFVRCLRITGGAVLLAASLSSAAPRLLLAEERVAEHLCRDDNESAPLAPGSAPLKNALGITSDEYLAKGWVRDGTRNGTAPWQSYNAAELAISSPGCQKKSWSYRNSVKSCQRYEPVHLYVALDEESESEVDRFAEVDSWSRHEPLAGNVVKIKIRSRASLQLQMAKLVAACKIVEFAFVDSHGNANTLRYDSETLTTVSDFLDTDLSICALAPSAKVQFAGCNVACGNAAETIKQDLHGLFDGIDSTRPKGTTRPFENVQLLMNTDLATTGSSFWMGAFAYLDVKSDNDLAVVYSVKGAAVTTDIPTHKVPACKEDAPVKEPRERDPMTVYPIRPKL